ncbi:MAG TPA: arsenite methyltransferase [Anaerolineae bacterium]|nr:arsenite methyltransferase [Anaerolineae bacterium]
MDDITIKTEVRKHYADIALQPKSCCGSDCCGGDDAINQLIDYGGLDAEIVEGANLGLGCGLPTVNAGIRSGDTVLDLGSGAGIDVFLSAKAVGKEGHVIGVDMTPEMLDRARANARKGNYTNVEFRLGEIEHLPVADNTVDVVISNCVINLVPDKRIVYDEIHRVLRSPDAITGNTGGHFSISDVVTYGEMPESIRNDVALWTGCIAGALDRDEYLKIIHDAGFVDVVINKFEVYDYLKGDDYGASSITLEGRKA